MAPHCAFLTLALLAGLVAALSRSAGRGVPLTPLNLGAAGLPRAIQQLHRAGRARPAGDHRPGGGADPGRRGGLDRAKLDRGRLTAAGYPTWRSDGPRPLRRRAGTRCWTRSGASWRRGRSAATGCGSSSRSCAASAQSAMAQRYGLASLEEARAYLAHPVLGQRLEDCTALVNAVQGRSAAEILGGVDALKFRSCMTLFAAVEARGQRVPHGARPLLRRCAGPADAGAAAGLGATRREPRATPNRTAPLASSRSGTAPDRRERPCSSPPRGPCPAAAGLAACSTPPPAPQPEAAAPPAQRGEASYYGPGFEGQAHRQRRALRPGGRIPRRPRPCRSARWRR